MKEKISNELSENNSKTQSFAIEQLLKRNTTLEIASRGINEKSIIETFDHDKVGKALSNLDDDKLVVLQALSDTANTLSQIEVIHENPQILIQRLNHFSTPESVSILYALKDLPSSIETKKDLTQFLARFHKYTSLSVCLTSLIIKTYPNEEWTVERRQDVSSKIDAVLLDEHIENRYFFDFLDYILKQTTRTHINELCNFLANYRVSIFDLLPQMSYSEDHERLKNVAEKIAEKILDKIQNSKSFNEETNCLENILQQAVDDLRVEQPLAHSLSEDVHAERLFLILEKYRKATAEIRENESIKNEPSFVMKLFDHFNCHDKPFKKIIIGLCFSRLMKSDPNNEEHKINHALNIIKFFKEIDSNNEFEARTIMNIFISLEWIYFDEKYMESICRNTYKIEKHWDLNIKKSTLISLDTKETSGININFWQNKGKLTSHERDKHTIGRYKPVNNFKNDYKREYLVEAFSSIEGTIAGKDEQIDISDMVAKELCNIKPKPAFSNENFNKIIKGFGSFVKKEIVDTEYNEQNDILINKILGFSLFINKFNEFLVEHYNNCLKIYAKKTNGEVEKWLQRWENCDKYNFTPEQMINFIEFSRNFDENRVSLDILKRLEDTINLSEYPIFPNTCIDLLKQIVEYAAIPDKFFMGNLQEFFSNQTKTLEDLVHELSMKNFIFHTTLNGANIPEIVVDNFITPYGNNIVFIGNNNNNNGNFDNDNNSSFNNEINLN